MRVLRNDLSVSALLGENPVGLSAKCDSLHSLDPTHETLQAQFSLLTSQHNLLGLKGADCVEKRAI